MKKKLILGVLSIAVFLVLALAAAVAYRIHMAQAMNPEGQYFNSQGATIHYREAGTGTPVILVHGLAVNSGVNFDARGVTAQLVKDYRVIALDNRGHGRSEKLYSPEAYGTEMCEDIIRLMDHLNIEKAHVLGYSMGGFIVLKLATLHPDRLLSFVICASGWTPEPEKEFQFFEDMAATLEKGGNYRALSDKLTPIGKKVSWKNRLIVSYGLKFMNDNKAIAAALRSIPKLTIEEELLQENTLPALAIVGDRDPLRPFTEQMAATTTNMEIVIVPDADHMSLLRREKAVDSIKDHLNNIGGGTFLSPTSDKQP